MTEMAAAQGAKARAFSRLLQLLVTFTLMLSTRCSAQSICPVGSSNCESSADAQYVYWLRCSKFDLQRELPAVCQHSLLVRELTVEPETTVISSLQARAFHGLRVGKLVLSWLGIESVDSSAFDWLAGDLLELQLDGNLLTTLPDGVFSPLANLNRLQLQHNRLTTISQQLFDGLSNLLVLDLAGNQISSVDWAAWAPVPLLSTLRLQDNKINGTLNSTRLAGLTALQELRLDGNQLNDVAAGSFDSLTQLHSLNIARNRIQRLPDNVFVANTLLQEVDASQNNIHGLSADVFNETKRLIRLLLHDNEITTLPIYVFRHMYNLRELQLQRNFISGVRSNSLTGLSSLRQLDLSGNRISSLPTGIFDSLGLVERLSLSDNQIAVVERDPFKTTRNLQTLDLSNNAIRLVGSDWFRTTRRLTQLLLGHNRVEEIEAEAFAWASSLQELYLNDNQLADIGGRIFSNCSSLTHLDLSLNPLRRLPDAGTTFVGLTSLRRMNLTSTCLVELAFGGGVSALSALEELDVSANTLSNLTASMFGGLTSLRRLHMARNDLDELDNATFSPLSSLELLDLSGNALAADEGLNAALSGLAQTAVVDLSWNLMTSVDALPSALSAVRLYGNPLVCDCNTTSWLAADITRLLDSSETACLDRQSGQPQVLSCYWSTCSNTSTVKPGELAMTQACVAPSDALWYLSGPRRRPAVVCPWDIVIPAPAVHSVDVNVISPTSIHVSWNITALTNVTVTITPVFSHPQNNSLDTVNFSDNETECTISNLTSDASYNVCVALSGLSGSSVCVLVELSLHGSTTRLPPAPVIQMTARTTESTMEVTWTVDSPAAVFLYRVTWLANGTDDSESTAWLSGENTTYVIRGLRAATVYRVCVQALADVARRQVGNATHCRYFSTLTPVEREDDDDNTLLIIIIIAASAGAFLLILLIIIICCCCCRRRGKDDAEKQRSAVKSSESARSTRSVNRGRLAEHSVVSVSVYDDIP